MIKRGVTATMVLVILTINLNAQHNQQLTRLEDYIEYIIALGYEENVSENLAGLISELRLLPVDINCRDEREISRLFFLTPFQVKSIIDYTSRHGSLFSKYELLQIPGFDRELAEMVSSFIIFREYVTASKLKIHNTDFLSSFILSGRDTSSYPGSAIRWVSRLNHKSGNTGLKMVVEKDAGEKFIRQDKRPEFSAGCLFFNLPGHDISVFIGDYRVRYGQGLNIWQGYSPGISPLNLNTVRGSSRIVPYSSSDENNFFRGLALSGGYRSWKFSIYASSNSIDANLKHLNDSLSPVVMSLYDVGLHNTETSISKRDVLEEYSAGFNINRSLKNHSLGMSLTATRFSIPFQPEEKPDTQYDFEGQNNFVFSIDHSSSLKDCYIYGEAAINSDGRAAITEGVRFQPGGRIKLNLLYSYLSRGYNSFHGHLSGKETVNNFRRSILANMQLELAPYTVMTAGITEQKELWFAYRSSYFPFSRRYMFDVSYKGISGIELKASAGHRETLEDNAVIRGVESLDRVTLNNARMHLRIKGSEYIRADARLEYTFSPSLSEKGFLFYQALRVEPNGWPASIIARLYCFNTSSYQTRIYAWEDNLLYLPSVPSFYGTGKKAYIILDFKAGKKISLRFKYGVNDFEYKEQRICYNEYALQLRCSFRSTTALYP